jgi:transcriptional regulator with XRE-family HTH domain
MENQNMKDMKYIIADNVKFYRKRENLTQIELAERAELSLDSIKRIEGGKRTMSLENFLRLSKALGIPLSFLIYEQKNRVPEEELLMSILEGRSDRQKKYLLHMLQEMADGMDKLL